MMFLAVAFLGCATTVDANSAHISFTNRSSRACLVFLEL